MPTAPEQEGVFAERLTGVLAPEGLWFGAPLLGVGAVLALAGLVAAGVSLVALAGGVLNTWREFRIPACRHHSSASHPHRNSDCAARSNL